MQRLFSGVKGNPVSTIPDGNSVELSNGHVSSDGTVESNDEQNKANKEGNDAGQSGIHHLASTVKGSTLNWGPNVSTETGIQDTNDIVKRGTIEGSDNGKNENDKDVQGVTGNSKGSNHGEESNTHPDGENNNRGPLSNAILMRLCSSAIDSVPGMRVSSAILMNEIKPTSIENDQPNKSEQKSQYHEFVTHNGGRRI